MSLFSLLAALLVVATACSSTTVVARDDRPTQPEQSDTAAAADSDVADRAEAEQDTEPDTTESSETDEDPDDDVEDDSRGSRDESDEPLTPRELEEAEGFGLGGAEQLAGLLADCEDGNDMACDILFELSGFDTVEESAALNCGGRSETTVIFCTEGVTSVADDLVFDITSEGLDMIVTECEGGDMTACDFLYFRSPFESTFEEIGATCGGRVDVAVPDCRTFVNE